MFAFKQVLAAAAIGAASLAATIGVQAAEPLNINTASAAALAAAIDGVGAQRAAGIVSYRENNGPFRTVEDLVNVQGIGQKILDGSRDQLTAGSGTN